MSNVKHPMEANAETWKRAMEQEKERIKYRSLQDVYNTIEKWLYIQDTKRIDALLATVISNQREGTPIWMFFIGNSGDTKSELISSISCLPNVIKIDQITPNTLASGRKDIKDLGHELQFQSHILIFPDLATLTSLHKDAKKEIWSQWRNLYDGFIYKRTGSGVNKAYEGCHVTVIAGATQSLRNEYHIHQQLGTRELLYDTESDPKHDNEKMDKAWENENYEKEMRTEIQNTIYGFWVNHKFKEIQITNEIKEFLKKEAKRLAILRATGITDWRFNELENDVSAETPTRLIKQIKRLYQALKSLDDEYPDERAMQIIKHIINSSGSKTRQKLLDVFNKNKDREYTISELQIILKIGRKAIKEELEILWNLKILAKDVREERVGGYVVGEGAYEEKRGGRWIEVAYYKMIDKDSQTKLIGGWL